MHATRRGRCGKRTPETCRKPSMSLLFICVPTPVTHAFLLAYVSSNSPWENIGRKPTPKLLSEYPRVGVRHHNSGPDCFAGICSSELKPILVTGSGLRASNCPLSLTSSAECVILYCTASLFLSSSPPISPRSLLARAHCCSSRTHCCLNYLRLRPVPLYHPHSLSDAVHLTVQTDPYPRSRSPGQLSSFLIRLPVALFVQSCHAIVYHPLVSQSHPHS